MSEVLLLENITKEFPKVVANKNVSLRLEKGEVHALLGENGAGKTTLLNCVCGLFRPTSGQIYIGGKPTTIESCMDAVNHGIGMVHQHFMLVPELTVAENVILGLKRDKDFFVRIDLVNKEVQELSDRYHFNLDPKALIKDLPVGMQQRVEILKTIYRQANIIILDEATAVLTPQEAEELFHIVENLTAKGKSVILITHKLSEVMRLADMVTVLRDGEVVGTVEKSKTNENDLARMMVGRDVLFDFTRGPAHNQTTKLKVSDVTAIDSTGITRISGLSFSLHSGEILGVAGVDGNGQRELSEVLTGMMPFVDGTIELEGKVFKKLSTKESYRNSISHIPQDRQHTGLIMDRTIEKNLILADYWRPDYSRRGLLDHGKIRAHAQDMIEQFNIKTSGSMASMKELSGGNQQKVVLARELSRGPEILIAVQPTRGLDIGATEFVRQKLIDERDRGTAVLLISTELEEILQIADRIAVLYKGEFMGIVKNQDVNINELGLMMAGVRQKTSGEGNHGK